MKHMHDDGIIQLSTFDIIKKKLKRKKIHKHDVKRDDMPLLDSSANHIAVILDGEVQEILRAENRLTALFLSDPEFVEFDPNKVYPRIGWKYIDGNFINFEESEHVEKE
jgi:hypothetical protein